MTYENVKPNRKLTSLKAQNIDLETCKIHESKLDSTNFNLEEHLKCARKVIEKID